MATSSNEQRQFLYQVRSYVPLAEAGGIPGAVMVAQAVLESAWGRSGLARLGNAYFGVKAHPNRGGKVYSGATVEWVPGKGQVRISGTNRVYPNYAAAIAAGCAPASLFRAYETVEDNIRDYIQFFHRNPRYRFALETYSHTRDPWSFARDIAAAGYATSPTYASRLIAFMDRDTAGLLPRTFTVTVNGVPVPSERVVVSGGRVYVHVRWLAAALGLTVGYDRTTRTVSLAAR